MPLLSWTAGRWILNSVYLLLLAFTSPVLLYRMLVRGKYRDGWKEKFLGRLPVSTSARPCLWFHAVSVGEVLQLQPVLKLVEQKHPEYEILISTTTSTGHAVACEQFPQHRVCYCPLDFSWSVRQAMRRIQPAALILVELELWPNLIDAAAHNNVPLMLINGRVSQRSFRGYCRIRPIMRHLLRQFTGLAVQNDTYADRLQKLGAPQNRLAVTGSVKFDRIETDRQNAQTQSLRSLFGLDEHQRVFLAGSTQSPEEEYAVQAYLALQPVFPDLRLLLVPRHPERFDEVADGISQQRLPLIRRSRISSQSPAPNVWRHKARPYRPQATPTDPSTWDRSIPPQRDSHTGLFEGGRIPPILLLDTVGELSAAWGLAEIAFVGGSLTNRGGQNMIEPAAYGAAVLFGPNTQNFQDVVDALLYRQAARVVQSGEHLTDTLRELLHDPQTARSMGSAAQRYVTSQQGAARKTAGLISQLLVENRQAPTSRAA